MDSGIRTVTATEAPLILDCAVSEQQQVSAKQVLLIALPAGQL